MCPDEWQDDALTVYGPSKVASSRQAWGALVTACTDGVRDGTISDDLYETATAIVAASSGVAVSLTGLLLTSLPVDS